MHADTLRSNDSRDLKDYHVSNDSHDCGDSGSSVGVGDGLYSIGELARRTGLTVKTIRFYSDRGIVAPTDRSPAGYRRYDATAVARLELVRTLRDLGLDLATVRKVVEREASLPEVAAAHADALAVQIRVLRLRHAVLTAVAERGCTPEETDSLHKLSQLTEEERRGLIEDFLHALFGDTGAAPPLRGPDVDPACPEFTAIVRSMTPELPDDPDAEQVRAWVELAELTLDRDFRAAVRRMVEEYAAEQPGAAVGPRPDLAATVRAHVGPALAAGIDPAGPPADPTVAALTAHYATVLGRLDTPQGTLDVQRQLLRRLESMNDPRRDHYFPLLAAINGWPAPEALAPVLDWSVRALRVRTCSR
ncbi:MerR family transcriptional regulator [Streptomyces endophytica]|uniref:MerR family transcriptional regulator n=1 Tax=Streptomyces endophytica TaxID=2991496 RepID=A0ABY6PFP0_9ACTN|nr:MerR family transcriptional regulator [Streptomyces endophytica]UZJ32699.1 MerR family transcriptional regulator [Streptomyces endophytica]